MNYDPSPGIVSTELLRLQEEYQLWLDEELEPSLSLCEGLWASVSHYSEKKVKTKLSLCVIKH